MPRPIGRSWWKFAVVVAGVVPILAGPKAEAHDHHQKTQKYEVVQGYIIQTQAASGPVAPAHHVNNVASAQSEGVTTPTPVASPNVATPVTLTPTPVTLTPTPVANASPTVTLQVAPAPAQTVQLTMVPAQVQTVQLVHVQMVQVPTVSVAPMVQTSTVTHTVATPVQILIPQKKCHLFGH